LKQLCPPLLWNAAFEAKSALRRAAPSRASQHGPGGQDLDIYWDEEMATLLDTWGEGSVWNEIQILLHRQSGPVLDIACGTGKTMQILSRFEALQLHGCDISDLLIGKALERGIDSRRLNVMDATRMSYPDGSFDFAYSIGSFEHFTEQGLAAVIAESCRVVRRASFHMVPVARSGRDEGWLKTQQSFFNNSVPWWREKFAASYPSVVVLDSAWNDTISVGKWFACYKDAGQ
jgi:ubiquinone/menaquinone biosynthesis C-methylase UbiE